MTLPPMLISWLHIASAALMGTLALLLVVRRREAGEPYLAASLAAAGWWALCNAADWYLAGFVGVLTLIPFLATFGYLYTYPAAKMNLWALLIFWGVPALSLVVVYTPALQPLYFGWSGGIYHPAYLLFLVHGYGCLVWLAGRLLRVRAYRLLIAMLPPVVVDLAARLWPHFLGLTDPAPLAFSLTGVLFFLVVYRFRFQPLSPIARSYLFEKFPDGLMVLDAAQRQIDSNEAARSMRLPGDFLATEYPAFLKELEAAGRAKLETRHIHPGGEIRYHEIEGTRLLDPAGNRMGYLVQFQDVHDRKTIEIQERKQRQIAEALQDIALTSTTIPDAARVLEQVSIQLFQVFDCTAAIIFECRDDGKLVLGSAQGHISATLNQWLEDGTLNWKTVATFQTMMETGAPLLIPDTHKSSQWVQLESYVRSWVAAPVKIHGATLGFLILDQETPNHFTEEDAQKLKAFADLAAMVIQNARLFRMNEELANTDPLTGLLNRRAFFARAELEFARAQRYDTPLSMLMIDLDHFKELNDGQGHLAGDKLLTQTAGAIQSCLRELDLAGRFGGDEFCILLPQTDLAGAQGTAARLMQSITALDIGVSIGVAALKPDNTLVDELLLAADQALYRAKAQGRNRVVG